ncbi:MAG: NUDIX domain-containing protein [Candidatus Promineifilaceae bacterium]|nr:NUDIX domain-containing protein [Candidatus Promineifilaceae bacterium]
MTGPKAENYDPADYARPSVTVDVVIFSLIEDDLKVLLVQRRHWPFAGMWAIPGGFVGMEESLEAAAIRELAEETGLRNVYLEQLYTFGAPDRDPRTRVITVAYFALIPADSAGHPQAGTDAADSRWFSTSDLPELAFDHAKILTYAQTRLRYKLEYTALGFELLPDEFTLSDLQHAYELILGEELDKRNFRRKILSAEIIEETGEKRRQGSGRPARLYRYRDGAEIEVKARRLFP